MKVVYILPISWGGIPHYSAELANAVAQYAEVYVLKPKDSNDHLFSNDVTVMNLFEPLILIKGQENKAFSLNNIKSLLSYNAIKTVLNIKPDIVHFPGIYVHASLFSKLYGLDKKFPIVQTKHSVADSYLKSPKNKGISRTILWNINDTAKNFLIPNKFIVHTKENQKSLINNGVSEENISIVPHGAYTFFKAYLNDVKNIVQNKKEILYFGFIDRHKGLEYFIEAASIVSDKISDTKFTIAGEGDLNEITGNIEYPQSLEVNNSFIPDEKVAELFQRASLIVLPYTYHQGLSGILAIAFAFGKPVIVTDVGDLKEYSNGCGLVVPPKDSKSLAEAIETMLLDDDLRNKCANNSYQRGLELSWDNIAKMHLKIYDETIEKYQA